MTYYHLFVGLVMLSIGSANPITSGLSNEPKRCCSPDVFSSKGNMSSTITYPDGTTSISHAIIEFARDGRRGFIGMRGFTQIAANKLENYYWNIYDLKQKIIYSIYTGANICQKINHHDSTLENYCLPDVATYLNSSISEYNGETTVVDTWFIQTDDSMLYQMYTRDTCIALGTEYTSKNPAVHSSARTTEYAESIVDPTILEIPSICPQ